MDQVKIGSVRQRTKAACEPCRTRKRKCDGENPCDSCQKWEYDCVYTTPSHKRRRSFGADSVSHKSKHTSPRRKDSGTSEHPPKIAKNADDVQQSMQANSSVVFPHLLGVKLNPGQAPKVHGFGWNLGLRQTPNMPQSNFTALISEIEYEKAASIYFNVVHPVYGFVNKAEFEKNLLLRWRDPETVRPDYDPIFCGVAALGFLFGNGDQAQEAQIVFCGKTFMEDNMLHRPPSLLCVTGWILRTLYLRATARPHTAWMASNITMHLAEATGIHQESNQLSVVYSDLADTSGDPESQRRAFWIAKMLNAWISQEYGRTRVHLPGVSCQNPATKPGDYTSSIVEIYQLSAQIAVRTETEVETLTETLAHINSFEFEHDGLVLSQSNFALTIYRRLRAAASTISNENLNKIIRLGTLGLEAATRMANLSRPWWHVLNVPFQFLCILLAIDTQDSLKHVSKAYETLKLVKHRFHTQATNNALDIASLLIDLSQKTKEQAASLLKLTKESYDDVNFTTDVHSLASSELFENGQLNEIGQLYYEAADFERFDWDSFLNTSAPFVGEPYMSYQTS